MAWESQKRLNEKKHDTAHTTLNNILAHVEAATWVKESCSKSISCTSHKAVSAPYHRFQKFHSKKVTFL